MTVIENALAFAEHTSLPDAVTRAAIKLLVDRSRRTLGGLADDPTPAFAAAMSSYPVALATADANRQHYEIPARFFELILGSHLKYSCCYYDGTTPSLDAAEARALALTAEHADLADGQDILELGCGWGSLSLWMAGQFPGSRITAVSNSASQRAHIEARARDRGLANLRVVTVDMNLFEANATFDRIVSVEMFEHMSNWRALIQRATGWLRPEGRLFLHVFSHRTAPYRFNADDPADWIGRHFFTGGIMPSHALIHHFSDLVTVEQEWRWSGEHYARTARDWLANYDRNAAAIAGVLADVYGNDAAVWNRRWRLFFLATEGLFGNAGGSEWGVSHYRLRRAP